MTYEIKTNYTIKDGTAGRYRLGKPEGVVIHSSGNMNAVMDSEIRYMTAHYTSAFTHAWCDPARIVEISNTDYPCWGAGRNANSRFCQIEMTEYRGYTTAQHKQTIDRACYWAAMQLVHYGLPFAPAKNGQGTVWSHRDVANTWPADTDHQDPHAYIARHGVTWQGMLNTIEKYYKELKSGQKQLAPAPKTEAKFDKPPFKAMQVGDTVTIRRGMTSWYLPQAPNEKAKPSKDFTAVKDTVKKVMTVNKSHSQRAYLLSKLNSWILEQDLKEPRKGMRRVRGERAENEFIINGQAYVVRKKD